MITILVVDDEPQIRRALATNLTVRGFRIIQTGTGAGALAAAATHRPDLVILDLGLPDLDGIAVVGGLRGWSDVPIIILSVRDAEADKVAALDAGADDYVTKPFGMDELLARMRAHLRRRGPGPDADPVIETPDFAIDLAAGRVTREGAEIHLTPKEWLLVERLARNPGRLLTHRQLLQAVWGPAYATETNYLRVYFTQIRKKLEPDPAHPRYVITAPGVGYRLELPEPD